VYYLAEDPWYLAGALGILALGFLIAVKTTQQGKYLVWAIVCLVLAGAVVAIEHFWVTDNERVEAVVLDLARAARSSDVEGVLAHLTPDVVLELRGDRIKGPVARAFIQAALGDTRFDFLVVSQIQTDVGTQTRQGAATFQIHAGGSHSNFNFATGASGSDWSMGVEETPEGQWKINRITATRLPWNIRLPSGGGQGFSEQ
jgi:ketosteroid isomerase-like protein